MTRILLHSHVSVGKVARAGRKAVGVPREMEPPGS